MLKTLFNRLKTTDIIVTPNRRLTIHIAQKFSQYQQNLDKKAWQEIEIIQEQAWIAKTWQNYCSDKILLNAHQEKIVWHKIIAKFAEQTPLLDITATTAKVLQAYGLLRQWQLDLAQPLFALTDATTAFQNWAQQFIQQCQIKNWISPSDIAAELSKKFHSNPPIKTKIILIGFEEISPQLQQLLQYFEVEHFDSNNIAGTQQQLALANQEQELINMALWAQQCAADKPSATIGCVIPEITTIRPQVENIFNRIAADNFDISVGKSLLEFPSINAAFAQLRSQTITEALQTPTVWAQEFTIELAETNNQIVERWHKLLSEFASLQLIIQEISHTVALQTLEELASNTIFQPKALEPKQIKILGTLEAAGLNFDYLWVMGLTTKNWPASPSPNPFIPLQLQTKLAMPHANAARELEFCRHLTQRFNRSAAIVIYSHPQQDGEELLCPSPLITNLPRLELATLNLANFSYYQHQKSTLETIIDNRAPTLSTAEKISGGSSIFRLQATCPFRAFAECRLKAQEPDPAHVGLSSQERGILVHAVLEQLWNIIGTQPQLASYSSSQLNTIINEAINNSLKEISISPKLAELENKRLTTVIQEWLDLEKQRPSFSVIATEKWQRINIGPLKNINVRIDRIDKLADGSLLIIDYKTGKASPSNWYGERPEDPQLPLYCVTSNEPIDGMMFAQVKNGELKFNGISAVDTEIPNIKTRKDWDETVTDWQTTLEKLATDFHVGKADVDPKTAQSCKYCKLQSLCRIFENHG